MLCGSDDRNPEEHSVEHLTPLALARSAVAKAQVDRPRPKERTRGNACHRSGTLCSVLRGRSTRPDHPTYPAFGGRACLEARRRRDRLRMRGRWFDDSGLNARTNPAPSDERSATRCHDTLVQANHLPPVQEQRAHRGDGRQRHLPATMTTRPVHGDEQGTASHAVDDEGARHPTLLQPHLLAENHTSRASRVIARWRKHDGIENEPCSDDDPLTRAAVPGGDHDEWNRCPPRPSAPGVSVSREDPPLEG
jgi:hypothetical protein